MLDTTTAFGRTLQEIAEAHGFSGADELVRAANRRGLPEDSFPWTYYGDDIDAVIDTTPDERKRMVRAWCDTYFSEPAGGKEGREEPPRRFPVRDRSGTAEALAKPLTDEERALELPCWVRHPAAGGQCPRTAATMVYGLLFCEEHGAEATAGALAELFQDAGDVLARLDNPHLPHPNQEAGNALAAAWRMLDRRRDEHEVGEEEALRRAYPTIPEMVCAETIAFDYRYGPGNEYGPNDEPTAVYEDARRLLCKQMRVAYEEGADWLVEILEYEREAASAQMAFALEDYERKTGGMWKGSGDRPAE